VEAAFFDLDKTVIARASMLAFGRPFYEQGMISRRTVLRAAYAQAVYVLLGAGEDRLSRLRESVLVLTQGWDQARVREIVQEALDRVLEPIIYREALDLIADHRAAGRLIVIVSAAPEEVAEPLGRYLGADAVIATQARVDSEGRYTGEIERYAYGPYKAEAMRELAAERGIDLGRSFAYTDSYTDLPMLEAVGVPVAVNPDRVLLRLARERGFAVLQFSRPVHLRSPLRRASRGLAILGVLAAAALLALAYRAQLLRLHLPRRTRRPERLWAVATR
jgi:HAD superfamily hydrolase (TIGR01490 family)